MSDRRIIDLMDEEPPILSDEMPKSVRIEKRKSEKALQAERILKWEASHNRSFRDVAKKMTETALEFFKHYPTHFSREIDRRTRNEEYFDSQIQLAMDECLKGHIDFLNGHFDFCRKRESLEWHETYSLLKEINSLIGKIPRGKLIILSFLLQNDKFSNLKEDVLPAIRRAKIVSSAKSRRIETRGTKGTAVSKLSLGLFESLELRLRRDLARTFNVNPSKTTRRHDPDDQCVREFTGLDAKLIFELVRIVQPNAVIDTVQSALKSLPARKSEKS